MERPLVEVLVDQEIREVCVEPLNFKGVFSAKRLQRNFCYNLGFLVESLAESLK